ncbi:MAG: GIY-YIG nuclease family protein [Rhodocyclaceae bacterium]|nr:GIY-YIG nuclease family protein [Rhodocyclaceae bacterium]MCA3061116.1 GIY-YIG nuclease family protein [Rhodocyclaceae bacterium]MCA3084620.1 GIY-YIG nuclease family protein [Rhodocyclaceae bacterium]
MPSPRRKQNSKAFQRPNTRGVKGWVYVITNAGMPGLVKVGFTMKDPDERARELAHTGNPHPYEVDYQVWVEDPYSVEQQAQRKLTSSGYLVGDDRFSGAGIEWFSCKIEQAIVAIRHATGGEYAHETFRRAEREIVEATVRKEKARQRALEHVAQLTGRLEKEFKRAVDIAFPPSPYWHYFLGCYAGSVIILAVVFSKMTGSQVFFGSFLFGGIAAFFLQAMLEDSYLKSPKYLAMKAEHEKDLENAKLHFFSCPHCSGSMKINYVESFAEGSRIKFHCKSCDNDVPNPLSQEPAKEINQTVVQFEPPQLPGEKNANVKSGPRQSQTLRTDPPPLSNEVELRRVKLAEDRTMLTTLNPTTNQLILRLVENPGERRTEIRDMREDVGDAVREHGSQLNGELPARPVRLRHLFVEVWSTDNGYSTMREDLWHSFLAELDCELTENAIQTDDNRVLINQACDEIWENRREDYRKKLWRELDDAIAAALPKERWGGR